MGRTKKQWSDLSPQQQKLIIAGGIVELVLTSAALIDLALRPSSDVRGPKLAWLAGFVVQPVGPIAYFAFGRRFRT